MKRISLLPIIILSIFILFTGCGFFEEDGTAEEITIVDNIKIHRQQNSSEYDLVYEEGNGIFLGIANNCKAVYYDSVNRIIVLENVTNEYHRDYYQVNIFDSKKKEFNNAIKMQAIDKNTFLNKTKNIEAKWKRENPVADDLLIIKKGEALFNKICGNCHTVGKDRSAHNSINSYLDESTSSDTIHHMFIKSLSRTDIENIAKYIEFKKDIVAIP